MSNILIHYHLIKSKISLKYAMKRCKKLYPDSLDILIRKIEKNYEIIKSRTDMVMRGRQLLQYDFSDVE